MIRKPRIKQRVYTHVTRLLPTGVWVCRGGLQNGPRCEFNSESYADAVTHATIHGATPPDEKSWTRA